MIANHVARLFGSGIADRATLAYLGAVLGEDEIEKVSTHRQRLELDLRSRTYSKDFKRLAAPDRVRQAERDTALLVYGNIRPAWISLRPWYRDRGLRAHVTAPSPPAAAIAPVVAEDVAWASATRSRRPRTRPRPPASWCWLRRAACASSKSRRRACRSSSTGWRLLGERMHDGDELHVTYKAMQSGWQEHPPTKGGLIRRREPGWTELRFEYRAFVVLRAAPGATAALTAPRRDPVPPAG